MPYTMASIDAAHHLENNQPEIVRQLADFPDNIWADRFPPFILDKQVYEAHAKEIEILKEQVRSMLVATENTMMEKFDLIDKVERLGISYHFENEIEEQLEEIFNLCANIHEYPNCDLSAAAIQFRLLRQHGFNISCGIFHRFMDTNGKFKESLSSDIRGLLNLHEAACVRTHKDGLLEEAFSFTASHLRCGALDPSSTLAKQVKYALKQALHRGVPRFETCRYISIYKEDESTNHKLLRLAELDYNLLYDFNMIGGDFITPPLCEWQAANRWENELDIVSKIPYARNRLVECYFWALGVFYEPQYSMARIFLAKNTVFVGVLDDTYDAYGTLDELKIYTDAIERWDGGEIDGLPDCMQTSVMALLKFHKEIDEELAKKQRSYASHHFKAQWKQYARGCYREAQWFLTKELPTFLDYLANGVITSTFSLLLAASFLEMDSATNDVFQWLSNNPKIVVASCKQVRLLNDVGSYEFEKQRDIGTAIECYMKDYDVSEQEAMKKFEDMAEDGWKDINEECLKPTTMSREIVTRVLNLARVGDVAYNHREDRFTHPHRLEPYIIAMLLESTNV